jgi:integrase/recombinase XerD
MPKNLKLRGNIWWFRKRINGKDEEVSLETSNIGLAKERRDRLLQDLKAQRAVKWGEVRRYTFNQAAERFGTEHFTSLKPKSRARYIVSISNLLEDFDKVPLGEISSARLGDFEQRRHREGVTNSTIRRDLACLSAIFSTAEEWEWVTKNPVKAFLRGRARKGLKEGEPRTRYLDHEEEAAILQAASPKAASAILFAIDTGLRKEEQFSLLWSRVDLRAREIHVDMGASKNSRPRTVPLLERTFRLLSEMARKRDLRSPYVFTTAEGKRYSTGEPHVLGSPPEGLPESRGRAARRVA